MPQSPLEAYQARVAAGALKDDPAQAPGVAALERLYQELVSIRHPERTRRISPLLTKMRSLAFARDDKGGIRGVYIYGPVGRGKSMVMDLFYDALPASIGKRRVHFHAFMIEVHDFLHHERQNAKPGKEGPDTALLDFAATLARDLRVLCFDEFHVTDVADAMILGRLFTALLDRGLVVVATSNWPPERLYEGGLQRDRFEPFIDLIKRRLEIVELAGPVDYRQRVLEANGVYCWPLGPHAQDWAARLFHELSGGASMSAETIEVKGRTIEVAEAARDVARFSFAQLCERPMGAEDYLAIAHRYHTVFLEGIPKLRYDRRNEVKRLMILVDAMYDTRTHLVVTADAPPEKLYFGTDYEFEFQRTVSRLLEMQSREWLGRPRSPA